MPARFIAARQLRADNHAARCISIPSPRTCCRLTRRAGFLCRPVRESLVRLAFVRPARDAAVPGDRARCFSGFWRQSRPKPRMGVQTVRSSLRAIAARHRCAPSLRAIAERCVTCLTSRLVSQILGQLCRRVQHCHNRTVFVRKLSHSIQFPSAV